MSNNATLNVQVSSSGGQLAMSSLTLGTSGSDALTNVFTLGANASTTTPAVAASGALTLNGTVTVNATGSGLSSGSTYLLLSYGSISGSGSFVAGSLPPISGFTAAITNDTTAKQLKLYYVVAPPDVKWAVGNGNWDTTTLNWVVLGGGSATNYTEGALAALDDSASGSSPITVTLTGNRSPNMLTNNSTKNYALAGSGSVLTGALVKNGASTLTLDNGSANAFSSVTISGGTIQIGNNDTGGSVGAVAITNNGTLVFNRTDSLTFANVISGSGGVTQSGSGAVTLSGANTYSGSTTVSAGKLVTTTASMGAGAFTVADGTTLEVQVAAAGKSLTNSSLTLGTSGNLTNIFTLGANGSTTVPAIQDNGALALNGTVTVNVTGTGLAAGTYPLIAYASTTGSGSFVAGSLPLVTACTGVLTNDTTAKQLKLVYTAVTTLTWDSGNTANGATIDAGSGTWDKIQSNVVWNDNGINRGWGDSIKALFAGSDGAWAITVATNISLPRMEFGNSGYVLSAPIGQTNSITLTATGSGAIPNIQVASGKTATIGTNVIVTSGVTCIWGNTNSAAGGELDIENGGAFVFNGGGTAGMVGVGTVTSVKTGGTLTGTGSGGNFLLGSTASDNCTLSVDGGTVSFAGTTAVKVGGNSTAAAVGGTLTVNSGSFSMASANTTAPLTLGINAGNLGTNNLNGGVLSVNKIAQGSGSGCINFNGGTLKAVNGAFAATFLNGLTTASVKSGGAVIDNNGFGITIGQALLNGGGTDGGLTSLGSGSLTLTGVNTYTGNTTISNGTLALSGSGSIANSAAIFVNGGATLDVSAGSFTLGAAQTLKGNGTVTGAAVLNGTVTPGTSIGTLTFGSAPTLAGTLLMEISTPSSADKIIFSGGASFGGTLTVTNIGASLTNGNSFDLFDGALSGTFGTLNLPGGSGHWNTSDLNVGGTISFTNASPVAQDLTLGVARGGSVSLQVIGGKNGPTDADGDSMTVTGVSAASSGTSGSTSSNVTYIANGGVGTNTFTYTVTDALGATDTKTVTVVVSDPQGFNQLSATSGGGNAYLTYLGIPGTNYALEVTHDLPATNWTAVVTNTAQTNGCLNFTNLISLSPTNDYYRTHYVP